MADLKGLIFPADLRVEIRSRPIMWICYRLLFTADVKKGFAWKIAKMEKDTVVICHHKSSGE